MSYHDALAHEVKIYAHRLDVHDLPPIFHYWSEKHLRPKFETLGLSGPTDLFVENIKGNVLSIGAGNCDLEIELAKADVTIDCLDLNPAMLARGRAEAEKRGLTNLNFITADINTWQTNQKYDAIIANQFLHHVVNLEGLLDQIKRALNPGGKFLISDMIGRNGHLRWPEALTIVHEFWAQLPPSYRFNCSANNYEELYQNWDCSTQGFEGVRAQDILPLLTEHFHFELFLPYGNLIDPFIDRVFGPHFDATAEWDQNFIDRIHQRDEQEIASGNITPTHMVAVLTNEKSGAPPTFYVRDPKKEIAYIAPPTAYTWTWPHTPETELKIACEHLAESGNDIKARTEWANGLNHELEERTKWAQSLEQQIETFRSKIATLETDLDARTKWAQKLDAEITPALDLTKLLQQKIDDLEQQIENRTTWALNLEAQLKTQTARAEYLENPLKSLKHRFLKS